MKIANTAEEADELARFYDADPAKTAVVHPGVNLDVFRHGHELYIRLGPYRRSFILPDALHRREVTRARLDGGTLQVTFGNPDVAK